MCAHGFNFFFYFPFIWTGLDWTYRMDLEEDGSSVRINVNGLGSREEVGGVGVGEYDYTTALTVTLTVGVCLILLNLLVFSAIMCHRKRGLRGPLSMSTTDSPGSRTGLSGTPLKSSYQVRL